MATSADVLRRAVQSRTRCAVRNVNHRIELFRHLLRLKAIPRTGWLDRGLPEANTESVADHILMMTLIGWITAGDNLDRDRVLKLALVHDLAEAIAGDPPPYDRDDVCLLYTSDAADDLLCVDLGGR